LNLLPQVLIAHFRIQSHIASAESPLWTQLRREEQLQGQSPFARDEGWEDVPLQWTVCQQRQLQSLSRLLISLTGVLRNFSQQLPPSPSTHRSASLDLDCVCRAFCSCMQIALSLQSASGSSLSVDSSLDHFLAVSEAQRSLRIYVHSVCAITATNLICTLQYSLNELNLGSVDADRLVEVLQMAGMASTQSAIAVSARSLQEQLLRLKQHSAGPALLTL
jgi:hypothetical protein